MDNLLASPDTVFNVVYLASVLFIISTILRAVVDTFAANARYRRYKKLIRDLKDSVKKPVSKKVIKKSN